MNPCYRRESERKYTELKSEASERIVPVMPILKIALENYKSEIMKQLGITDERLLDNESMFKTKNGNTITSDYLRHRLHYVLKKYGFEKHITVHELRHTFATRCLESGIDMKTVQTFLGHADYKLTANTYSHVLRQTKNNQILKYNTYLTDTIQKSLEDIVRACFRWGEQLLDISRYFRASSCFVVNNPQGTFFCIHTVDCATQTESERSLSCLYSNLF